MKDYKLEPDETPVIFECKHCGHDNNWTYDGKVDLKEMDIRCEKCGEIYNPDSYAPDPYDVEMEWRAEIFEMDDEY